MYRAGVVSLWGETHTRARAHTHTHTDTHTDTQADTHTDTQTHTHRHTHTHTHKCTRAYRHTHTHELCVMNFAVADFRSAARCTIACALHQSHVASWIRVFSKIINLFSNWPGCFFLLFLFFFRFFLFFFWILLLSLRTVATHLEVLSKNGVPPGKQCTCFEFSSEDPVVKLTVKKIYQFCLCDAGSGTKCHQSLGKLNVEAGTWNAAIYPFPLLQVIEYLREKHGKDITRKDIMECFLVGGLCLKRSANSRPHADLCVWKIFP